MWDFSLLLLHWLQCSLLLSYIVREVSPTYKEPSFTSFNSFSSPAPSLHLEQMFSYTSDDLVHCGRTSAFWLQVVQSPLPHAVPQNSPGDIHPQEVSVEKPGLFTQLTDAAEV